MRWVGSRVKAHGGSGAAAVVSYIFSFCNDHTLVPTQGQPESLPASSASPSTSDGPRAPHENCHREVPSPPAAQPPSVCCQTHSGAASLPASGSCKDPLLRESGTSVESTYTCHLKVFPYLPVHKPGCLAPEAFFRYGHRVSIYSASRMAHTHRCFHPVTWPPNLKPALKHNDRSSTPHKCNINGLSTELLCPILQFPTLSNSRF